MKNLQVEYSNVNNNMPISVSLRGNLTSKSAIDFKKDLLQAINQSKSDCYLNITELQQLDVTGVNALAMAHKSAQRIGRKLVIISSESNPADEFLHLTKFSNYFNFKIA